VWGTLCVAHFALLLPFVNGQLHQIERDMAVGRRPSFAALAAAEICITYYRFSA
jgi:hypothetical protein